jgi:hypothetical protein
VFRKTTTDSLFYYYCTIIVMIPVRHSYGIRLFWKQFSLFAYLPSFLHHVHGLARYDFQNGSHYSLSGHAHVCQCRRFGDICLENGAFEVSSNGRTGKEVGLLQKCDGMMLNQDMASGTSQFTIACWTIIKEISDCNPW